MTDADPQDGRDETAAERNDRNWTEILQELRVIQTGTQILTGFLLTLAFQQRFTDLDTYQVDTYLVLVAVATLATILALTPVAIHRTVFRMQAKESLVLISNRLLKTTLIVVGLTLTGTTMLVFDVVVGRGAGIVAGVITLALALVSWLALPVRVRWKNRRD